MHKLKPYQQKLLEAALVSGALRFGEFVLKSGRKSPYFWNAGRISSGKELSLQAEAYAEKLNGFGLDKFDVVFGPAYKGIPIATGIVLKIFESFSENKKLLYNRKELKEYGDKLDKYFVGSLEEGNRIVIVDDVITTGKTKKDEIEKLEKLGKNVEVVGIVVGLNRQEVDEQGDDPIEKLQDELGIPVEWILGANEMFEFLHNRKFLGKIHVDDAKYKEFQEYQKKYGVRKFA